MGKYSDMVAGGGNAGGGGKYSRMLAGQTQQPTKNPGDAVTDEQSFGQNVLAGLGHVAIGAKQSLDVPAQWIADHFPGLDKAGKAIGLPTAKESAEATQETIDRGKPFENRLLWHSGGGVVGNLGGNALLAYGFGRMLPGGGGPTTTAGKYASAAAIGAATGGMQPVATGDSRAANAVSGAVGGLAGQAAGDAIGAGVRLVKNAASGGKNAAAGAAILSKALDDAGIKREDLSKPVLDSLEAEVKKAVAAGGALDEAALRRKLDFTALGLQPRQSWITRDPQQFANEHTLAGLNGVGKPLADIESNNNAALIANMNKAGAAGSNASFEGGGDYAMGNAIHQPLLRMVDSAKAHVSNLYKQAEDMNGRPIEMDHVFFTQRAGDLIDKSGKNYFLPDEFKTIANDIASGKYPLTVGTAEQIKTALATASRSAKDGNAREAMRAMRQALEETPIIGESLPGSALAIPGQVQPGAGSLGQDTINAFRQARNANRTLMGTVESSPAVKDVFEGIEPDRFFQKHVVGANVNDLKKTADFLKQDPQAFEQVRSDIVGYLKNKALNGASDEVGKFSQSGFNKALDKFGKEKLSAFFSPEEIGMLQRIGRVASYMQVQPAGARVNNSNTAAQVANVAGKVVSSNALIDMGKKALDFMSANGRAREALNAPIPYRVPSQQQEANALLRYLGIGAGAAGASGN